MIKFKPLTEISHQEIEFILKDLFNAKSVTDISRDEKRQEITLQMTTVWNDGEEVEIEDEIMMDCYKIDVPFSFSSEDKRRYQQFLLAKGYHPLLKDNIYLEGLL